ncbi:MAG: tyrosine--tRNA ligase [Spirochaetaceae bacterium]|nr:MAG: tyrosine--tRNA ligase [Spirochaetaceae bacterium]
MSSGTQITRPGALERLKERGFFAQCTDEGTLRKRMDREPITFYVGIDPTGDSLHVGHLVPLYAMAHMIEYGHRAIVIVGAGTARIGDPSGKTEMRRMLTEEQIDDNAAKIGRQIERFLRGHLGENQASFTMVNNMEWLAKLNYIDFLRDIGRHFSVNRMLGFETYKIRLETGLSFIEFNYQLLQSYDFLKLYQTRDCRLQIGGDDQWGNIVAGADLIRRIEGSNAESFGLTFPLVTRSDGKKMGKTEQGAVFLSADRVSPYDFFQYWRNVADADVRKFLLMYTFLPLAEIEDLTREGGAALNAAKERLAYEVTVLIHGQAEADAARAAAQALFAGPAGAAGAGGAGSGAGLEAPGGVGDGGAGTMPIDVPGDTLSAAELRDGIGVLELYVRAGLCASRGEARRLVQQGGASINEEKVMDPERIVGTEELVEGAIMLRAGKKRFFRFSVE